MFDIYDICISFVFLHLEVGAVSVVLDPGDLVLLDGHHGVLHGLVDDGVDGADEEVEAGEQLLPVLGQVALRLRVEEELLLQLGGLVSQVGETLAKGILNQDKMYLLKAYPDTSLHQPYTHPFYHIGHLFSTSKYLDDYFNNVQSLRQSETVFTKPWTQQSTSLVQTLYFINC